MQLLHFILPTPKMHPPFSLEPTEAIVCSGVDEVLSMYSNEQRTPGWLTCLVIPEAQFKECYTLLISSAESLPQAMKVRANLNSLSEIFVNSNV